MRPEFELARKLRGPSQLERVRAARAIIHSRRDSEAMALTAFMEIFHPDYSEDKKRELVADVRNRTCR